MVFVSSCCGCIGLEKGTTIISVLQMVAGAIAMIYKSYVAATLNKQIVWEDDPNVGFYKLSVAAAVASALHVLFGFLLYSSIPKKSTKALLSWVCFMSVAITISLVFLIIMMVKSVEAGAVVGEIVGKLVFGLAVIFIEIYLVAVVYSFYQMMRSDNSMQGY